MGDVSSTLSNISNKKYEEKKAAKERFDGVSSRKTIVNEKEEKVSTVQGGTILLRRAVLPSQNAARKDAVPYTTRL